MRIWLERHRTPVGEHAVRRSKLIAVAGGCFVRTQADRTAGRPQKQVA
jgi:hypothetical protein